MTTGSLLMHETKKVYSEHLHMGFMNLNMFNHVNELVNFYALLLEQRMNTFLFNKVIHYSLHFGHFFFFKRFYAFLFSSINCASLLRAGAVILVNLCIFLSTVHTSAYHGIRICLSCMHISNAAPYCSKSECWCKMTRNCHLPVCFKEVEEAPDKSILLFSADFLKHQQKWLPVLALGLPRAKRNVS